MRIAFVLSVSLSFAAAALGQGEQSEESGAPSQEALKELRAQKFAKDVFKNGAWLFDFDAALATAKKTGKPIFAYFTRSYAPSRQCDALEAGPLSQESFRRFSESVVLFVHNTSRVDGESHATLLREKGFSSHPTICFMDGEGRVLVREVDPRVSAFVETAGRIERVQVLQRRLAAGEQVARDLFFAELDLRSMTVEQIRARAAALSLSDADLRNIDPFVVAAELRVLRDQAREIGHTEVLRRTYELAKAQRRPTEEWALDYWQAVLTWCSKIGDGAVAQRAWDELQRLSVPAAVRRHHDEQLNHARNGGDGGKAPEKKGAPVETQPQHGGG